MKERKETKKEIIIASIIALIALLLVIGGSYAYFTANVTTKNEEGNKTTVTTATLVNVEMEYGGTISSEGIYPGHKIVKTIHVTGEGNENSTPIPINLTLTPHVSDFPNHVRYSIYGVDNSTIDISSICGNSENQIDGGKYYDSMECDTSKLGNNLKTGIFVDEQVEKLETLVEYNTDRTYYIIIEYINETEGDQNSEQGKVFTINLGYEGEESTISMVDYLTNLAKSSENLAYDETEDNNLRYIGANPNNYVKFNNELWRIIGIMNNIEDSEGNKGSHIKLIRNESIGNYYWSGSSSNQSNDWTKSTLNTEVLNGTFYNGLTSDAKSMISNVVWNLGGQSTWAATASTFYTAERGTNVYSGRSITWTGNIAIMYASDYGYAVGKNVRDICLATDLSVYHTNNCYTNDWLYLNEERQFTLTPDSSDAKLAYQTHEWGHVRADYVYDSIDIIRPVLYLKSNIKLIGTGDGSEANPFVLSIR